MADRVELAGFGIGTRAVAGPAVRMPPPVPEPAAGHSDRPPAAELDTARAALAAVAEQLRERAAAAGGEAAEVLQAQALMALDPQLAAAVEQAVAAGRTAARAVYEAFETYLSALAGAGAYLAGRVADLADVRQRAVAACLGVPVPAVPDPGHPFVLVAQDLAPADTATLALDRVLGFVTVEGGPTSHTAVLARSRDIPAVVGCTGADRLANGVRVLVDPARSVVVGSPEPAELPAGAAARSRERPRPQPGTTGPGRTADGHPVALLANLADPAGAAAAVAAGAEGVGLLRTEFLFLGTRTAPDLDQQRAAYRRVFQAFPGGRVIVRMLDAGADKPLPYLAGPPEPNPALGRRGLRALRAAPGVLRTQLAAVAVAAAAADAEVWVMAPMVAEPAEAAWFTAEAAAQGLPAGVMIEVPSAALLAEEILAVTGFVSLGTNDLAQYALAADRQLGGLGPLQDPWHPAVLRLVRMAGQAGARAGKPVGVCGEAAADPLLAVVLVGLGATSLSMAPPALAGVRAALAGRTLAECRELADRAAAASSAAAARAAASE
jgi:phosphotransferase system enzyme I (PtsI)